MTLTPATDSPGVRWPKRPACVSYGNCVEVASLPHGGIGVRDSKDAEGPVLRFMTAEWDTFIAGADSDQFDPMRGCFRC